jgi:PKD repeat protein
MWLHGSNVVNSAGSYGIQGVSSPANVPPAFYEACEWTDLSGNFWLLGGYHNAASYGDLWKYDRITNEWTWMRGTTIPDDVGNFGTRGIPAISNLPPARSYGAATWTDNNGDLWVFGGTGNGGRNDLWRYNIATNIWTWMKGDSINNQPGVYGTQGVPDTTNKPGARWETSATWTDAANDLWLFGGLRAAANAFNDLWRYNIATNTWTWMKGSNLTAQTGIFGIQGVESPANTPGARMAFSHWKDAVGNFWIFAGSFQGGGDCNDMWRYNPASGNWAWMGGSIAYNDSGFYGTKCISSPANLPTARKENRASWKDTQGNFWFFGGVKIIANNVWNDLWKYCASTNEWIWVSGDSTTNALGNWGTRGVSAATNIPQARTGSVGWTDGNNHLYFFGGSTAPFNNPYNDIWVYAIDTTCAECGVAAPPVASFLASDTVVCANDCIDFTDLSTGATSWQWSFAGATPSSSAVANPQNICYDSSGIYAVMLIVTNAAGSDTLAFNNYITVYSIPNTPVITQSGDTLFSSTGYTSYQWYFGSDTINGATNNFYVATQSGNYNLAVTGENGCSVGAGIVNVIASLNEFGVWGSEFWVAPNPARDELTVYCLQFTDGTIEIYNSIGVRIYFSEEKNVCRDTMHCVFTKEISLKDFAGGIYVVQIKSEEGIAVKKFIIQK